jgi:hypothetical protein
MIALLGFLIGAAMILAGLGIIAAQMWRTSSQPLTPPPPPLPSIAVIAGTREQFERWRNELVNTSVSIDRAFVHYCNRVDATRGRYYTDVHYVGTWADLPQLREIEMYVWSHLDPASYLAQISPSPRS